MVGQAYHAGVLAALQVDLGWDARNADIVVGTSAGCHLPATWDQLAGSLTGAMLRAGTSPFDLASWGLGTPVEPRSAVPGRSRRSARRSPRREAAQSSSSWQIPALGTWVPLGGRSWAIQPLAVLASMLPEGKTEMKDLINAHMADWAERGWPDGLWICTVKRKDGTRVVFGQQPEKAPDLSVAIAASTAIPGYFAPVTIEGQQFLDGGLYSPTNADLFVQLLHPITSPRPTASSSGGGQGTTSEPTSS